MGNGSMTGRAGGAILAFLRSARRRYLLRDLLAATWVSAAASLAIGQVIHRVNRALVVELPVLDVGLPLFAILLGLSLVRNRTGSVASRVDRGLGLRDRLTSFLDFARRESVDAGFRRAQAEETSAALAQASLQRGIPIRRLLWAGPPAFAWMLYLSHLAGFTPHDFRAPVQRGRDAGERGDAGSGEAQRQGPDDGGPPRPDGGPDGGVARRPAGAPPDQPPTQQAPADQPPAGTPEPQGERADGGGPAPPVGDGRGSRAIFSEPARLYSEAVGTALTPVVEAGPGSRPGSRPGIGESLRGRVSFNLVPADGKAGGQDGPEGAGAGGGRAGSLEITVDYDAIPPQYREQVRRYFEALTRHFAGGQHGT